MTPAACYASIHSRLRLLFGPASDHLCSRCMGRARDWAYMYDDPDAQPDPRGDWSPHVEHYTPLCKPCHKVFDEETAVDRNAMIRLAVTLGETQTSVARQFGISRQRVHQIVHGG